MKNVAPDPVVGENGNHSSVLEQNKHLLRTKFYVPPIRSNQIIRPRLLNLINDNLDRDLVLISASAGYGKTSLVSRWLKESRIPNAWLSLDSGDNDPNRFIQYLLAALIPFAPEIQNDLLGMLNGIQPSQFENLVNQLVNELAGISQTFVLVLDDFHVIQSEIVLKIITHLLEHLPDKMRVMILTRTDPPLPLSRFRVSGRLLDIRAEQLRFTIGEIGAFLNDAMGLTLSDNDLSALETRTEGWIAGLQLAALSMQSCDDIHGFVSAFTGSHHYVIDYLVEEVLKHQPAQVSTFLIQTSILDRLCGSLCEAILEDPAGRINGQRVLESLEEMNLFTIPLDGDRNWYRYHHLFADVLRKRLEHQFPLLLPELHRRASHWYEQNGFIAESIQQAIEAGDQDRASHLIEENGCFLLMSGEVTTLLKWTDAIDFQSDSRPWLAIQKAWALALTGNLERIESLLQAPEKILAPLQPTDEVRTMQGTIAAARAFCANLQGDSHLAAKFAIQALDLLPNCSSISQSIRSVATSILGDTSWVNGNMEEATRAYIEAIRIGHEGGNLHMVMISNCNLAETLIEQGQLNKAVDIIARSFKMAVRPDGQKSPLAANLYSMLGRLAYEHNRLEDAEQYLHQCIDLCCQWGDKSLQTVTNARLARLEQARGHSDASKQAMRETERLINETLLTSERHIHWINEVGRYWLRQGNIDKASQLLKNDGLSIKNEIEFQREPEFKLLLRILIARGENETALQLSERLLKQAETTGRMGTVIETLILQALIFQAQRETDRALSVLERALALAEPEGYVRVFLDEGEEMTRLLCQVQSRQIGSGYSAELLRGVEKASDMTPPSMQLLIEPLTTRELEVLKFINAGSSNQDIASQLVISLATVKRHISNIYAKLGVKSRTQAVAVGKEFKILE